MQQDLRLRGQVRGQVRGREVAEPEQNSDWGGGLSRQQATKQVVRLQGRVERAAAEGLSGSSVEKTLQGGFLEERAKAGAWQGPHSTSWKATLRVSHLPSSPPGKLQGTHNPTYKV